MKKFLSWFLFLLVLLLVPIFSQAKEVPCHLYGFHQMELCHQDTACVKNPLTGEVYLDQAKVFVCDCGEVIICTGQTDCLEYFYRAKDVTFGATINGHKLYYAYHEPEYSQKQ